MYSMESSKLEHGRGEGKAMCLLRLRSTGILLDVSAVA
jgi:hypothetical protein